jgi:hypothetical protein
MNLAAKETKLVNELNAVLQGWKRRVGAEDMKPNPQFREKR